MKYCYFIFLFIIFSCSPNKLIFKENFSNNKNQWDILDNKDFKVLVDSGVYQITKKIKNFDSRGCLWLTKEMKKFSSSDNFSISFDIRVLNQKDDAKFFDFMWGNINLKSNLKQEIQYYQIQISEDQIKLNQFGYQDERKQNGWTSVARGIDGLYKNYSLNKWHNIQILQLNSELIIYRDQIEIFRSKIKPTEGNMIGIQNCTKSEIQVDNLIITKLKVNNIEKTNPQ